MDRICKSCSHLRQIPVLFTFLFVVVYGSVNHEFQDKMEQSLDEKLHDISKRDLRVFDDVNSVRSKDKVLWKNLDDHFRTSVYDQAAPDYFRNSDVVDEVDVPTDDHSHLHTINKQMSTIDRAIAQLEEDLAESNVNKDFDDNSDEITDQISLDHDDERTELGKRPAFTSWAGKRARSTKRRSFTVRGGRRSQAQIETDKRPAFHSWSGKRSLNENSYSRLGTQFFNPNSDEETDDRIKRPSFNPWGGKKRSDSFDREAQKRPWFHSWGGKKRAMNTFIKNDDINKINEATGDRTKVTNDYTIPLYNRNNQVGNLIKRPAFHSWSGKRASSSDIGKTAYELSIPDFRNINIPLSKLPGSMTNEDDVNKRPAFASWAGKRGSFSSSEIGPSSLDSDFTYTDKRPQFHSWSGKRSHSNENQIDNSDDYNDVSRREKDQASKRPRFFSWGGKKRSANGFTLRPGHSKRSDDSAASFLRALTKSLSGMRYENQNLGALLTTLRGRQQILIALKSLYNLMVNRRNRAEDNLLNDESLTPRTNRYESSIRSKPSTFIKRPAFHSWGGKRSVNSNLQPSMTHLRRRRSLNLPKGFKAEEVKGDKDTQNQEKPTEKLPLSAIVDSALSDRDHILAEKKPSFHSWSGKRNSFVGDAGQSKGQISQDYHNTENGIKRNGLNVNDINNSKSDDVNNHGVNLEEINNAKSQSPEKRPAFHLQDENQTDANITDMTDSVKNEKEEVELNGVNKDLGNLESNTRTPGKDDSFTLDTAKRPAFHSWSGKRNFHLGQGENVMVETSQNVHENKRQAFNSWLGKRSESTYVHKTNDVSLAKRPAFSSWSGKRSNSDSGPSFSEEMNVDKKAAFHSWSGKRSHTEDIDNVKRPSFHSWSGKRSDSEDIDNVKRPSFHSWSGKRSEFQAIDNDKRPSFHSWSGKRSDSEDIYNVKRPSFHSWSGKRSDSEDTDNVKRPSFHSWSGKRSDSEDTDNVKRPSFHSWSGKRSDSKDIDNVKRPSFHSWSGKRSDSEDIDNVKRPSFHSWSGKRSDSEDIDNVKRPSFHSWSGKRSDSEDVDNVKRPSFHSWSGKRSEFQAIDNDKRPSFHSWSGKRSQPEEINSEKRPSFHSWSGKRSDLENTEAEKRTLSYSWSGKSFDANKPHLETRAAFHSWSGKRTHPWYGNFWSPNNFSFQTAGDKKGSSGLVRALSISSDLDKRPAFHSWSGKRGYWGPSVFEPIFKETQNQPDGIILADKRPSFHSWSGKRADGANDNSVIENDDEKHDGILTGSLIQNKRPAFSSWSGKRNMVESGTNEVNAFNEIPALYAWPYESGVSPLSKRPAFHSWSGKRQENSKTGEQPEILRVRENVQERPNSKSYSDSSSDLSFWSGVHDGRGLEKSKRNSLQLEPVSQSNHVLTKRFAIADSNDIVFTGDENKDSGKTTNSALTIGTSNPLQERETVVYLNTSPLGNHLNKRDNQRVALGRLIRKVMTAQPYIRRRKFFAWAGKRSGGRNSEIEKFRTLS